MDDIEAGVWLMLASWQSWWRGNLGVRGAGGCYSPCPSGQAVFFAGKRGGEVEWH